MARAIRWQIQFTSLAGNDCHVDIYKEGYTGSGILQLTGTANPFEYQEDDDKDLLHFVRYKTGYIRFWEREGEDWSDVYPDSIQARYVKAYYDSHLVFTGYLQCQEFDGDWVAAPRELSIPVISPLGLLDSIDFDKPSTSRDVPGFNRLIPDMVTMGALMRTVIEKLGADYQNVVYPGATLAPWNVAMFATIYMPFNKDFKHWMTEDDLFAPHTLSYFIDGICAWLGWIIHDAPMGIVFQQLEQACLSADMAPTYSIVAIAGLPTSRDTTRGNTTITRRTVPLDGYFEIADNESKQSKRTPLKKIVINAEGDSIEQKLDLSRTKAILHNGSFTSGQLLMLDPQITAGRLCTYFDILGNSNGGTFPYATNIRQNTVKLFVRPPQNPVGWKFFGMKFCNVPKTRKQFVLVVKISRGTNMTDLQTTDYTPFKVRCEVRQGDYTFDITNIDRQYQECYDGGFTRSFNCYNIEGTDEQGGFRYMPDITCEPIEVNLYFPDATHNTITRNDFLEITECSLYAADGSSAGFTENQYYDNKIEIQGSSIGIGEQSISVNFQNYAKTNNSHSFGTDEKITDQTPAYSYMFRPQCFLTLTLTGDTGYYEIYNYGWQITGDTWRVIADKFNLRDDQHTLLFTLIERAPIPSNLLTDTNFADDQHTAWYAFNATLDDEMCNGMPSVYCQNTNPQPETNYIDILRQYIVHSAQGIQCVEEGQWYTLSFYARGKGRLYTYTTNIDTTHERYATGGEYTLTSNTDGLVRWTLTDKWVRRSVSFMYAAHTTGVGSLILRLVPNNTQDAWVKIAGIKLEHDNGDHRPTKWVP